MKSYFVVFFNAQIFSKTKWGIFHLGPFLPTCGWWLPIFQVSEHSLGQSVLCVTKPIFLNDKRLNRVLLSRIRNSSVSIIYDGSQNLPFKSWSEAILGTDGTWIRTIPRAVAKGWNLGMEGSVWYISFNGYCCLSCRNKVSPSHHLSIPSLSGELQSSLEQMCKVNVYLVSFISSLSLFRYAINFVCDIYLSLHLAIL